ncbi:uncharacterized protein [Lepeophtheirus salmonis]|nr:uncharacterized protein LOC121122375 isoform X1 [Lepeophtheirus salmonis]
MSPGNHFHELNRSAVFENTRGNSPSYPLHVGAVDEREEGERLRSCYSLFHGPKHYVHGRNTHIFSRPSSHRLLCGTNEFAEYLTGQREPLHASRWSSETNAQYKGKHMFRASSAPGNGRNLLISQMKNQDSIFGRTERQFDLKFEDWHPHSDGMISTKRYGDMYQTSYSFQHRPFTRQEQLAGSSRERPPHLPWLDQPNSQKEAIQVPNGVDVQRMYPTEAQVATLPHYLDPKVKLGRSEIQESFSDPSHSQHYYTPAPKMLKSHLEPSYLN